ncbi:hypothetical protein GGR51DRAFT_127062 [Nemania sp. FL0031]|nr:hypothetical protein GGR51DRAFT_127062 [Nemania sp. FL0031]
MSAQPYTLGMARQRPPTAPDSSEPSFHLFSQLPPELRLMIWSFTLPGPRIISLRCEPRPATQGGSYEPEGPLHGKPMLQCRSPAPVPTTLHVCGESRYEALRRYKLLFGIGGAPGTIYFDPLSDALYFGSRGREDLTTFMAVVSPPDKAMVRHIAVNEALISGRHWLNRPPVTPSPQQVTERLICQVRARFRNLRRLTFVCLDRNPLYSSDAVFVEAPQRNRFIERQIKGAIDGILSRYPSFAPPSCRVGAIAAAPSPPTYKQGIGILGCRGRRSSFVRSYPRLRRYWSSQQCACNNCGYSRLDFRLPCTKPTPYPPLQGHALYNKVILEGSESNDN